MNAHVKVIESQPSNVLEITDREVQSVNSPLNPNKEDAVRFLEMLDPESRQFTFQVFPDDKSKSYSSRIFHGALDQELTQLTQLQADGAGVFVTINKTDFKGRKTENIIGVRSIFADCDGVDPEMMTSRLQPHILVESSPGKFHVYWLVSDCPLDQFKWIQRAISQTYGTDIAVCDLPRVMRLPGFWHQKSTPFQTRIIQINQQAPYTFQEIKEALDLRLECSQPQTLPKEQTKMMKPCKELDRAIECLKFIDPDIVYKEWLKIGMALHHLTGGKPEGLEVWINWSQNGGKFKQGECQKKWFSFRDFASNALPVTVRSIFHLARQNGWCDPLSVSLVREKTDKNGNPKGVELRPESEMAKILAQQFDDLIFDNVFGNWYQYDGSIWQKISTIQAMSYIKEFLDLGCIPIGFSNAKLNAMESLLKIILSIELKQSDPNLLPFQNGVLDMSTGNFMAHEAEYYLTWQLPHKYSSTVGATPVINWLKETLSDDPHQVEIIRAFGKAVLTGKMVQIQKYLELIGVAGSGKSSIIRMLALVVGQSNYYTTTLKQLENNRFETANLYGKKLVAITDSESFSGDISTLKAATGGDDLRYEIKNAQASQPFKFAGGIVVASNQDIRTTDHTNGLQRRRITMRLSRAISPEDMIDLDPLFNSSAVGLINWMLGMSDNDMSKYLKTPEKMSPALAAGRHEQMLNTNQLYRWFDECVDIVPGHKAYIGKSLNQIDALNPQNVTQIRELLYPNYTYWVQGQGNEKSISLQNFSTQLISLLTEQLKLAEVQKSRNSTGVYIEGIKLKNV